MTGSGVCTGKGQINRKTAVFIAVFLFFIFYKKLFTERLFLGKII